MRWPLIAGSFVGAIVAVGALVVLVGRRLPVGHVVARRTRISAAPDEIWATVTDVAGYPAWRPSVSRVVVAPTGASASAPGSVPIGAPTSSTTIDWAELSRRRAVHYRGNIDASVCRFTTRITGRELPYGGSWQIDVTPCAAAAVPGGGLVSRGPLPTSTLVTITERGEVYGPVFRALSRYVIGYSATIDGYLRDLGKRFSSAVVIEAAEPAAPGDTVVATPADGARHGS